MHRLYLQIYLAIVAILLLFALLSALAWWTIDADGSERRHFEGMAAVLGAVLPAAEEPLDELQVTLERLVKAVPAPVSLSVFGPDGALLAAVGEPLAAPEQKHSGWMRRGRSEPGVALHLPDGRWLVLGHKHSSGAAHALGLLATLALLAVAVMVGAYPVARRLTRRLERLQQRVDALGEGDLAARVGVEGRDEVADLARSFNQATERIAGLVEAQRRILAGASHELRSPLARLRVAVELLGEHRPQVQQQIARDIEELDELIEELLLASRLDIAQPPLPKESVDLLALAAEEGARIGVEVGGEAVVVSGERRPLQRMLRNLFENAQRHGGGQVEVKITGQDGTAVVQVADRGPGVAQAERERIFEPFYRPAGTAESGSGVGLGLALVRQIARRHGGEARCLPREGGGTCFEVVLKL